MKEGQYFAADRNGYMLPEGDRKPSIDENEVATPPQMPTADMEQENHFHQPTGALQYSPQLITAMPSQPPPQLLGHGAQPYQGQINMSPPTADMSPANGSIYSSPWPQNSATSAGYAYLAQPAQPAQHPPMAYVSHHMTINPHPYAINGQFNGSVPVYTHNVNGSMGSGL